MKNADTNHERESEWVCERERQQVWERDHMLPAASGQCKREGGMRSVPGTQVHDEPSHDADRRARQFVFDAQQLAWPPMLLWHVQRQQKQHQHQQASLLLRLPHSHSAPCNNIIICSHPHTHQDVSAAIENFVSKNGQNSLLGWAGEETGGGGGGGGVGGEEWET